MNDPQFLAPDANPDAPAADPEFTARYGPVASAMFTAAQMHAADENAPERDPEHDHAVPAAAPPVPAAAPPTPLAAGTYALYQDGIGGVFLVLGLSTGETMRHHIPAGMIKMAERFGPGGGIGKIFGLGS